MKEKNISRIYRLVNLLFSKVIFLGSPEDHFNESISLFLKGYNILKAKMDKSYTAKNKWNS